MSLIFRKPLRKGSLVYHGSGLDAQWDETTLDELIEQFGTLDGPAWVSNAREVALYFSTWHGHTKRRVLLTYKVTAVPRLMLVHGTDDFEALAERLGADLGDTQGMAAATCQIADGWHIPDNYPEGSDTMLCEPGKWLRLERVEEL